MVSWFRNVWAALCGRGDVPPLRASSSPWARFDVTDFGKDGRIRVEFDWNDAFIKKARELGFTAETDEDTVQLFFVSAGMRPTELDGDMVPSHAHPNLNPMRGEGRHELT